MHSEKEINIRLPDDTIIAVSSSFEKRWKKFGDKAVIAATLTELFPFLVEHLDDTMYGIDTFGLPAFVSSVLAMRMIWERYNNLPEFILDGFLPCGSFGNTFNHYTDGKTVFLDEEEKDNLELKQLVISEKATEQMCWYLSNLTIEKPQEPLIELVTEERSGQVIDATPEVQEVQGSYDAYKPSAPKCAGECQLCTTFELRRQRIVRLDEVPYDLRCQRHLFDRPIQLRLFQSRGLNKDAFVCFGSSFRVDPLTVSSSPPGGIGVSSVRFHAGPRPITRDKVVPQGRGPGSGQNYQTVK